MEKPLIRLENITFAYDRAQVPVLNGLSLQIHSGEWVHICGPSGSGKSALAALLSGLIPRVTGGKLEGEREVAGLDPSSAAIADMAGVISAVFQDPDAQLVLGIVEDEVAFGPENLCVPRTEIRQRVESALADVELLPQRSSSVHQLSGGQRQRTGIAAALALAAPILLLDDAAASLDPAARRRLQDLLRSLRDRGGTIITLSSRLDAAAESADRLLVLADGAVRLAGPPAELLRREGERLARLGVLPRREAAPAIPPQRAPAAVPNPGDPAGAGYTSGPTGSGSRPLLSLRGLSYAYPRGREALRGVSLELAQGEWALLCGTNGSGKTTLAKLLIGLLRPPKGTMLLDGQDIAGMKTGRLAESIGFVFQEPEHQFVTGSVIEEMLYGPKAKLGRKGAELPQQVLERAQRLLAAAGLSGRQQDSPYLLSGGEKRLLGAAAQFMTPKKLYILDEPTAGTDYAAADLLVRLCRGASAEGAALLVITHEPELFGREADVVFTLRDGELLSTVRNRDRRTGLRSSLTLLD